MLKFKAELKGHTGSKTLEIKKDSDFNNFFNTIKNLIKEAKPREQIKLTLFDIEKSKTNYTTIGHKGIINAILKKNKYVTAKHIKEMGGFATRTLTRYLSKMRKDKELVFVQEGNSYVYRRK